MRTLYITPPHGLLQLGRRRMVLSYLRHALLVRWRHMTFEPCRCCVLSQLRHSHSVPIIHHGTQDGARGTFLTALNLPATMMLHFAAAHHATVCGIGRTCSWRELGTAASCGCRPRSSSSRWAGRIWSHTSARPAASWKCVSISLCLGLGLGLSHPWAGHSEAAGDQLASSAAAIARPGPDQRRT